jgi:hypothetical protein
MMKFIVIIPFFLLFFRADGQSSDLPSLICSDSVKKHSLQWANIGFGISSGKIKNSIDGYNIGVNYHWLHKRITYQAGLSGSSTLFPGASLYALNAGIGKTLVTKPVLLSLVAGPGITWGQYQDTDNNNISDHYVMPGIAITAEVIVRPVKNFGVGCEIYTNFTSEINSSGIRFVLHLNTSK